MNKYVNLIKTTYFLTMQKMPVWEISGAEFSQAEVHTANGISIRFPRVTKIRNDKDWKTATSLTELQVSRDTI